MSAENRPNKFVEFGIWLKDYRRRGGARFDQFCDYTSILGFRLLRSENPLWLRLLTSFILLGFVVMVYVQTREAFQRFIDPSSKPVPRYEASQTDAVPRPGYIVCFDRQSNSVLRGYGSLDFRLLFFEFAKIHPNGGMLENARQEYYQLEQLFSNPEIDEEEIELTKSGLHNFPEIKRLLSMDTYTADPYVWMQLDSFRSLRELKFSLDDCWQKYAQRTQQRTEFVRCRWEKAKRRFDEFTFYNENFFEYFYNTSMRFEDIFLNFGHQTDWHPDYGPCETIYPSEATYYNETDVQNEMHDSLLIRTNYYEAARGEYPILYLFNSQQKAASNEIRLTPGEYIRLEIVGFQSVRNELCENSFNPLCAEYQNISTYYTWRVCRWCELWSQTCTCGVPMKYHVRVTLRNCTMFEAMRCIIRYKEAASKGTTCDEECERENYVISTRHQSLTPEMIPDSLEERLINESVRFTFRAVDDIYSYISQYYITMQLFYRVIYGDDFKMPVSFLENMDGLPALEQYNQLFNYPLNDCGYEKINDLQKVLAEGYFIYFRAVVLQKQFPCLNSISLQDCHQVLTVLNKTSPIFNDAWEDGDIFYERVYMDLMINVNATVNPMSFMRSYSVEEDGSSVMVNYNRDRMQAFLKDGTAILTAVTELLSKFDNDTCLLALNETVRAFLSTKYIANTERISQGLYQIAREHNYLALYDNFATRSSAFVDIYFYPYTRQVVTYPADYNFWTFLAEFGGVLGLYFGVTVITIYETIFFFFTEPDTPQVRQPERTLSMGAIYPDDRNYEHSLAVPR